jgi:protein SCO1/2
VRRLAGALAALLFAAAPAPGRSQLLKSDHAGIGAAPRIGATLPPGLAFEDERGEKVGLGGFFGDGPVILALGYYRCRTICDIGFRDLAARRAEAALATPVVLVSIDRREGPAEAIAAHQAAAPGDASWHFLTDRDGIDAPALARAVGLPFRYDPAEDVYAHAATLLVVDRRGRVAAALPELGYDAVALRRAVGAASDRPAARAPSAAVLLCYAFDPATGRYSLAIERLLQLAGAITVASLAGGFLLLRFGRRR